MTDPVSYHFPSLRSQNFPQGPILQHPHLMFPPLHDRPSFKSRQSTFAITCIILYILIFHILRPLLDGPGSNPNGVKFSAPVQTGPEVQPASYIMGNGSFPGVKRPGRGVDHPPLSRTEFNKRVQLYLYSPSGPFRPRSLL